MSSPGAGFLEGLVEGGQAGYGFREGIKRNKRQQALQDRLLQLRELAEGRAETTAGQQTTLFNEQQDTYNRAQRLRAEVGGQLAIPVRQTLGQYLEGRPGTRRGAPPLSREGTTAQAVGRALGHFGGVDLSGDESLLLGSGMVPASTLVNLARLRAAAAHRGAAAKLPITLDHAYQVIDNTYGIWRGGERIGHHLTPAQRSALAQKLVNGTVQPSDFPDIPGEMRSEPQTPAAAPEGPGLLDRIINLFRSSGGNPTGPGVATQPNGDITLGDNQDLAAPTRGAAVARNRIDEARQAVAQYRDLPPDDVAAALREDGYDEEEIRDILGSPTP